MNRWHRIVRRLTGRTDGQMTCAEAFAVLQAYLDGEVDADIARAVAEHLHECADCAMEFGVYDRIRASLALQADELSTDADADIDIDIDPVVRARLEDFVRSVGNTN